jgi:hypothetical protein
MRLAPTPPWSLQLLYGMLSHSEQHTAPPPQEKWRWLMYSITRHFIENDDKKVLWHSTAKWMNPKQPNPNWLNPSNRITNGRDSVTLLLAVIKWFLFLDGYPFKWEPRSVKCVIQWCLSKVWYIFYTEWKGLGSRPDIEREGENRWILRGKVWVRKGCCMGHKLGIWTSNYEGLEKGYSKILSVLTISLSQ